jgi:hypothetical protein
MRNNDDDHYINCDDNNVMERKLRNLFLTILCDTTY